MIPQSLLTEFHSLCFANHTHRFKASQIRLSVLNDLNSITDSVIRLIFQ